MLTAIVRGICAFLGLFTLLNSAIEIRGNSLDQNRWWIDLPDGAFGKIAIVGVALLLLAYAVRPLQSFTRRYLGIAFVIVFLCIAAWNAVVYHRLLAAGLITTRMPVPISFSLIVVGMLATIACAM